MSTRPTRKRASTLETKSAPAAPVAEADRPRDVTKSAATSLVMPTADERARIEIRALQGAARRQSLIAAGIIVPGSSDRRAHVVLDEAGATIFHNSENRPVFTLKPQKGLH